MERYDVVIVGGSCAGAAAGTILAKAGRNTLIIDKAKFPRQKLCGGMITEKTVRLLQEIYSVSFDTIIDSRYNAFGVYHSSLGRISSHRSDATLSMIHRDTFDDFFLEESKKAGCKTCLGDKVVRIHNTTVNTASGREIATDFIIGADGSNSIIRKQLYGPTKDERSPIALEVDISYENLKYYLPQEEIFPWIFFGYVKTGYGWLFPKKDFVTAGLAGMLLNDDKNLLVAFKRLLATVCLDPTRIIREIKGHPVPLNARCDETGSNNILLIGDAAKLVEPLTGEGIYFAALSGSLAAKAILTQGNHAHIYNSFIKQHINSLFWQARLARAIYFNRLINAYAMHKMKGNAKWCKYFLGLLSGEMDYIKYFTTALRDRAVYHPL
jgi:geranylgeranyl reductase family protein